MLPQILIAKDKEKVDLYIQNLIREHTLPNHAVFNIVPTKKELGIDQIRLLKKSLIVSQKQIQLFILHSFHTATIEAQNAFLKTLEEKSERNIFLLLSNFVGSILPTILSRSQLIILDQEMPISTYTFMSQVITAKNNSFLGHPELQSLDSEKATAILEYIALFIKSQYRSAKLYPLVMKKVLACFQVLNNNNANPQLLIDTLLIAIHRQIALDQIS